MMKTVRILLLLIGLCATVSAREPDRVVDLWSGLAPGETTRHAGDALPRRADENPPATRIEKITLPQLEIYEPARPNGVAVVIMPGGAYNYVVRDKEGSEPAEWLNGLGITAGVLRYRTKDETDRPLWERPVEDGQRAISLIRARADEWKLDPTKIGLLGFSAGGQAAAMVETRFDQREYEASDAIDSVSCRPDFALLIYPWKLVNDDTGRLKDELTVSADTPPTFLVHAHDDAATSLSSVLFYAALKQQGVMSELHVYETGGHGYGLRPVKGSVVNTWPDRAADWLRTRGIVGE